MSEFAPHVASSHKHNANVSLFAEFSMLTRPKLSPLYHINATLVSSPASHRLNPSHPSPFLPPIVPSFVPPLFSLSLDSPISHIINALHAPPLLANPCFLLIFRSSAFPQAIEINICIICIVFFFFLSGVVVLLISWCRWFSSDIYFVYVSASFSKSRHLSIPTKYCIFAPVDAVNIYTAEYLLVTLILL